jgi:hypothetical protein
MFQKIIAPSVNLNNTRYLPFGFLELMDIIASPSTSILSAILVCTSDIVSVNRDFMVNNYHYQKIAITYFEDTLEAVQTTAVFNLFSILISPMILVALVIVFAILPSSGQRQH